MTVQNSLLRFLRLPGACLRWSDARAGQCNFSWLPNAASSHRVGWLDAEVWMMLTVLFGAIHNMKREARVWHIKKTSA